MKTLAVLFGIAQCLAVIAPTNAAPNPEHEHHNKAIRHRPKRQYPGDYGYHPQWLRPNYLEPRRDDIQDLLPKIYRLLEELADSQRRPQPPQPIYIPYPIQYPVQYPVPVYCNCQGSQPTQNLTFPSRFPSMEDTNQNWGYDLSNETPEDYSKNTRPINFERVTPPTYTSRPPPKVDHGTSQADINDKTPREGGSVRRPKRCDATVLSCCNPNETRQQHHRCFATAGCAEYFEQDDVCSTEKLNEVLDLFASVYAPKN